MEKGRPTWLPKLDLRYLTREPKVYSTKIVVHINYHEYEWIDMGQTTRLYVGSEAWRVEARMGAGATDKEENSAYAFSMHIVAPIVLGITEGNTYIKAIIEPDPYGSEYFRVPVSEEYDPRKHSDATVCKAKNCLKNGGPHAIVPEGMWMPPPNPELFQRMRGLTVTLQVGARKKQTRN